MNKTIRQVCLTAGVIVVSATTQAQLPDLGGLLSGDVLGGIVPASITLPVPSDPAYVLATLSSVSGDLLADPAPLVGLLSNTGLPFLQDQTPVVMSILENPATALSFLLESGAGALPLP